MFNVLVWILKVSFVSVKAFAQDKCPDTFPLFSKIDVNGANEAMAQSIHQSIHVDCRCSLVVHAETNQLKQVIECYYLTGSM